MPKEIKPETPTEGGRVYKELTVDQLETYATDGPSGYEVVNDFREQVEDELTAEARANLAAGHVHAVGFEVEVDASAGPGPPPFLGVDGAIGVTMVWLVGAAEGVNVGPHVYVFANRGADGVEPIGEAPDPSAGIEGRFFTAYFGGGRAKLTPEAWEEALGTVGVDAGGGRGLLSGEVTLYSSPGSVFVWDQRDVWYAFVVELVVKDEGQSVSVPESSYSYYKWLLGQLGLVDGPEASSWTVPDHPFWENAEDLIPEWARELADGSDHDPRDDIDGLARYGGSALYYGVEDRTDDVSRLQADLWELGFWITGLVDENHRDEYGFEPGDQSDLELGEASGTFGAETVWALREFQIYAGTSPVARDTGDGADRYVDNLEPAENEGQYDGDITGMLDEQTAATIRYWLQNDFRCPVVVEAYEDASTVVSDTHDAVEDEDAGDYETAIENGLLLQNFWGRSDPEDPLDEPRQARMFATDFSGLYDTTAKDVDVPPFGEDDAPGFVVGQYSPALDGGPVSDPEWDQTWPVGEITPEHLVDGMDDVDDLVADAAALSTFKVVRAVSEVECLGFFDSVNSYDNAVASVGPCHWTLTLGTEGDVDDHPEQAMDEGELPGYLSYLEREGNEAHNEAFEQAFGRFGLGVGTEWGGDGGDLYSDVGRKYLGTTTLPYPSENGENVEREETKNRDRNYLRTWHWFYRWVTAGRTVDDYRSGMWDMARIRIRDIKRAQFPDRQDMPSVTDGGNQRPARIEEVFTSERAIAMILRWHIRAPGHVISGDETAVFLHGGSYTVSFYHDGARRHYPTNPTGALSFAEQNGADDLSWDDPSNWGDAHEEALAEGVVDSAEECADLHQEAYDSVGADNSAFTGLDNTIRTTNGWPGWVDWQDDAFDLDVDAIADHERGPGDYDPQTLDDLLSNDRDSFDFDSDTVGEDPPS